MADLNRDKRVNALHHFLLKKGRPILATDMATEFACHEKTVRRTFEYMRDVLKLDVEFDPINETWCYNHKPVELPLMLLSEADCRALLFALRATGQLECTPICDQVNRVYNVLLAGLPSDKAPQFIKAMQYVRFAGQLAPTILPDVWSTILLGMEDLQTLHIHYRDGGHGSNTFRDIDPYTLIMRDRRWLLVAYCHWSRELRTFSMHNITSAQTTDHFFDRPTKTIEDYLANSFGGYPSSGEAQTVVLRIPADAKPYIREKQWTPTETRTTDATGNILVTFQTTALFAVEREVLAEAGQVELLEPPQCRQHLREAGARLMQTH